MGKGTGIAWCSHTFNPWWGCTKVSPACDRCYAAAFDARFASTHNDPTLVPHWGPDAPRKFFGDKHWNEPLRWNKEAARTGERALVFCASMADVFETYHPEWSATSCSQLPEEKRQDPLDPWRAKLWDLIARTPALTWLLLTKRPQNIGRMLPASLVGAPHVWLGTTIEAPSTLWRADKLIEHGAKAPVRFVSMEPLIEETSILEHLEDWGAEGFRVGRGAGINWVITGCESGAGARHTPTNWYRQLRDECAQPGDCSEPLAEIPFFFKQAPLGSEGVTVGSGSWIKGGKLVEQPYLDGIQHVAFPSP